MILTLVLVLGFVGFRGLFRDNAEVRPDVIDYLPVVQTYQDADVSVLYPASLPKGWKVTSLDNVPGERPVFGMGMLTDDDKFIGYTWADRSRTEVLSSRLGDSPKQGSEVSISNDEIAGPWTEWKGETDTALVTEFDDRTLMVWGDLPRTDMTTLIGELTTETYQP